MIFNFGGENEYLTSDNDGYFTGSHRVPVSSSGHLAIFKHLFHIDLGTGILFDVLLHLGTLISVFVAFRKDILRLIVDGFSIVIDFFYNVPIFFRNLGRAEKESYYELVSTPGRKMVMMIIVATIPTGILGIVGKDFVEYAQGSLLIPGICLLVTAILLFFVDYLPANNKKIKDITYLNGFETGIVQGIATLPGISRSGSTMAACIFLGFDRKFAVKFSFLMSIPAVLGAVVLEIKDISMASIEHSELVAYLMGMFSAAIVGYIAIKTVLVVVKKRKFIVFSIYCFAVGVLAIIGNFLVK